MTASPVLLNDGVLLNDDCMVHVFTYLEPAALRSLIVRGGCCYPAAAHQARALLRAAFPRLACYEGMLTEWVGECVRLCGGALSFYTLRLLRRAGVPMDGTALESCARIGCAPAVRAVLAAGADAAKGVVWQSAPSALQSAVEGGHLGVARILLEVGAPVTYHALRGATRCHAALALLSTYPRAGALQSAACPPPRAPASALSWPTASCGSASQSLPAWA